MTTPFDVGFNQQWNTPGWTVQNPTLSQTQSGTIQLPLDIDIVQITGLFGAGDGGLANGWFYIDNQDQVLLHASNKESFTPIKFRTEIRQGQFSITVPATDTPVLSTPTDDPWYYHIRVTLQGVLYQEYWNVSLPLATPQVTFYDITGDTNPPSPDSAPLVIIDGGSA